MSIESRGFHPAMESEAKMETRTPLDEVSNDYRPVLSEEKSFLEKIRGGLAKKFAIGLTLASLFAAEHGLAQQEKGSKLEYNIPQGKENLKVRFMSSDVTEVLKEQRISFDEKTGDFVLWQEKVKPDEMPAGQLLGVKTLTFVEVGGARTDSVQVRADTLSINSKVVLKMDVYNSDDSIEHITLSDGKLVDYGVSKPQIKK